jgi:GT2 family glycosyltransferase
VVTLTVAICTRNRAARLRRALGDLAAQDLPAGRRWEVLVVDNGSTDDTPAAIAELGGRLPVRGVREERVGLSAARNRAVAEAGGDFVVFTDDDVRIDPSFAAAHVRAVERDRPGYVGGRVEPLWEEPAPRWLGGGPPPTFLDGVLGSHDLGPGVRAYAAGDPPPLGANFGIAVPLARSIGGFREDLGLCGDQRLLGEETEWVLRAQRGGAKGTYVGEALVRHPVDVSRLGWKALWRHGVRSGITWRRVHPEAPVRAPRTSAALFVARGLWQGLRGRRRNARECVMNAGIQVGLGAERRRERRVASDVPTVGAR